MFDRLLRWWDDLRSSYWFIPSLLTFAAFVLAVVLPAIDAWLGSDWIDRYRWLAPTQPEGARSLLATIAGSMITVGGVAFSVTIAAVAYATAQFGPRLLTNFMRDTGNQVALGMFTATFLYCILVLRGVRSPGGAEVGAVVPHISVLAGVILAVISLGVLIYFFHHVPATIHAESVVGDIGRQLETRLGALFPPALGIHDGAGGDAGTAESAHTPPESDPEASFPDELDPRWRPISVSEGGYLQFIAVGRLTGIGEEHDLRIRVAAPTGTFLRQGEPACFAWATEPLPEEVVEALRSCFAQGRSRTDHGDVLFLTQELVEISARALSPGIFDPFTAMNCIDWIVNGLSIAGRGDPHLPPGPASDTDRLRIPRHDFDALVEAGLAGLRSYVAADRNAALHLATNLQVLMNGDLTPHARRVLEVHTELFVSACDRALPHEADRTAVRDALGLPRT
ncbi:MAG TPA: DUF2254 domain-containing protein [Longimicrobiales bacterium]|nr:DUF2254 domain-containing protein [Longimicrobiales bacterium]